MNTDITRWSFSTTLKEFIEEGGTIGDLAKVLSANSINTSDGSHTNNFEDKKQLFQRVNKILLEPWVTPSLCGYDYILMALMKLYYNPSLARAVFKEVYSVVAENADTSVSAVYRSIRTAIQKVWLWGDLQAFEKYFGNSVSPQKGYH